MRWLGNEIVGPILRRGGTAFGAYLIGIGVHSDSATQIAAGVVAALGVILDLTLSHWERKP